MKQRHQTALRWVGIVQLGLPLIALMHGCGKSEGGTETGGAAGEGNAGGAEPSGAGGGAQTLRGGANAQGGKGFASTGGSSVGKTEGGAENGAGGAPASCVEGRLPADNTRPGYSEPRDPLVASLLKSMPLSEKVKQLYGVTAAVPYDYRDIHRAQDSAPLGDGKVVRGFRFRDGNRGVNLVAGQDNRYNLMQEGNYSTAFPAQSVRGASWDLELEYAVGKAIGDETMASKNNLLLAPSADILRHPFSGRSQETYGEDVHHVGRMASAFVAGAQQHVPACVTHFAGYSIEAYRQNQNMKLTQQTLREIYTRQFEMVVQDGGVACVMAAYNSVNGIKATQNKLLLTDILRSPVARGGMGFRGFVVSDWWAMPGDQSPADSDRQPDAVTALKAGLDIEIPWGLHYGTLEAAVSRALVSSAEVDESVGRVLEQKARFGTLFSDQPFGLGTPVTKLGEGAEQYSITNNEAHLELAELVELKSAVLLANGTPSEPVLPIKIASSIAVIGLEVPVRVSSLTDLPPKGPTHHFATDANIGDRGSNRVNNDPATSVGPLAGIAETAAAHAIMAVTSANNFAAAANADFVVVVVGLNAGDEGEEYSIDTRGDRRTLDLPSAQRELVEQVLNLDKPTAIVIESGSVVNLPWLTHPNRRQATIWAGYGGQRIGAALGKLLLGDANFSGKLPFSWPIQSQLQPFMTGATQTELDYYHGYRDYDQRSRDGAPVELVFPFGHGLSYTSFAYSNLQVPCSVANKQGVVEVSVDVKNTGVVAGEEVVMLFVAGPSDPPAAGVRPVKELKGFQKVNLEAGSTKSVSIPLRIQDLRHWEGREDGSWIIDEGEYQVLVGSSADPATLQLAGSFRVEK